MSDKPKKKFSFKSLRLRFRHGSSSSVSAPVEQQILQRSVSEPADVPVTQLLVTSELSAVLAQPTRSQSDDAVVVNGGRRARLAAGQSPPSAFRLPTPETSESGSEGESPRPDLPAGADAKVSFPEPIQMPTPSPSDVGSPPEPASQPGLAQSYFDSQPATEVQPGEVGIAISSAASQEKGDDVLESLAPVAQHVENGEPRTRDGNIAVKALDAAENRVDAINGAVGNFQQMAQPVISAIVASGAVDAIKSGLNSFMEDIPWLMKSLDEVAKIHPFVTVVVLAFKAVYTMEMTRRNNDKRITALYVSMKDMISVLVQLRKVKDVQEVGPGGMTVEARLTELSERTASDIKACANVCDTYTKKRLLVKVLKGQIWEGKLVEWIEKFTSRKAEFEFALVVHTARAVDATKESVEVLHAKIDGLTAKLLEMFKQLTPSDEVELARRVQVKGGINAVKDNDHILRELLQESSDGDEKGHSLPTEVKERDSKNVQAARAKPHSTYTLSDLKEELFEDSDVAIKKNFATFEYKFALQQRQLREELTKVIREENDRVIDAVNRGPHDLIKHEELKAIWREMGWRRNVKARLFVMTLRDNFSEVPTRTSTAVAAALGKDPNDPQHTDEWALAYISITYLQPIMEAFDDDGSGYITVTEVNRFVDALPVEISWTLPHWIAYWAIGWQQAAAEYCRKIRTIFGHMHAMRASVLPENRHWVDYYLGKVWRYGHTFTSSLRFPEGLPDWLEEKFEKYVQYEEKRIRQNLVDIHYDIDALDTVYIVAGPGRIEKTFLPLFYLLLKRDLEIFEVAKTQVLNQEELWDSADSILYIYGAMIQRHKDLEGLFKQQKLDVAQQFKTFASEIFDFAHDDSTLFGMAQLATDGSFVTAVTEDPPVGQWGDEVKLLNYPLDEKWPWQCEAYETVDHALTEADEKAPPALKALLGQWNGFAYTEDDYPANLMTSFFAHASPEDGKFEASGISYGTTYTLSGSYEQDSDGNVSLTFIKQYAEFCCPEYFSGHLLADGSIAGTQGWDDNSSEHPYQFFLRRASDEIMCHRPAPKEFAQDKPKALWKFLKETLHAQWQKKNWSWARFAERRDQRNIYVQADIRLFHYSAPLSEEEMVTRRQVIQHMTSHEASFIRTYLNYQVRIIPAHNGYICDECDYSLGGARLVCLDCQNPKGSLYRTIDLCDLPQCYGATVTKRDDLERPHIPEHDMLKIRRVMQISEQPDIDKAAKAALKTCRARFTEYEASAAENNTPSNPVVEEAPSAPLETEDSSDETPRNGDESDESGEGEKGAEKSREDENGENDGKEQNGEEGEEERKGESRVEGGEVTTGAALQVDGATENEAATSAPAADENVEDTPETTPVATTIQPPKCGICLVEVEQPCWYCVDCDQRDTEYFICNDCEGKTLLRCVACGERYVQPAWYYGCRKDDNFMCGQCNWKRVEPPAVDKEKEHTYLHALVRCKPKYQLKVDSATEERMSMLESKVSDLSGSVTELGGRVSDLDDKVNALDGKVSRLQDYLVRMEATLASLLLKLGESNTSSLS